MPNFNAAPVSLSVSQTAKALRISLKAAFPKTKFSVRSKSYSGGASIHFGWTNGPTIEAVKQVSDGFAGARFDGSIDMAYGVTSWMQPDGAIVAHSEGSTSSRGSHGAVMHSAPGPCAILVKFGADYVFPSREYSDDVYEAAVAEIQAKRAAGTLEESLGYSLRTWINDDRILALNALSEVTM